MYKSRVVLVMKRNTQDDAWKGIKIDGKKWVECMKVLLEMN
jgi:hypothetical protein